MTPKRIQGTLENLLWTPTRDPWVSHMIAHHGTPKGTMPPLVKPRATNGRPMDTHRNQCETHGEISGTHGHSSAPLETRVIAKGVRWETHGRLAMAKSIHRRLLETCSRSIRVYVNNLGASMDSILAVAYRRPTGHQWMRKDAQGSPLYSNQSPWT